VTASLVALVREGVLLALLLAAPLLVAALVAGVLSGLLAAFTQIQDPAVSLLPRVAAVAWQLSSSRHRSRTSSTHSRSGCGR